VPGDRDAADRVLGGMVPVLTRLEEALAFARDRGLPVEDLEEAITKLGLYINEMGRIKHGLPSPALVPVAPEQLTAVAQPVATGGGLARCSDCEDHLPVRYCAACKGYYCADCFDGHKCD
jgi:hypothetical protein